MSMAHSLELRCPYLDWRLAEFAAREIPPGMKVRRLSGKLILKQVAKGLIPKEIIDRNKWGFKVPMAEWFRGPLQQTLKQVLLSKSALARGYFRQARVQQLIDEHVSGQRNNEKQLWILFQLELWH